MAENSPFLKAKVGDIVHFSSFYNSHIDEPSPYEKDVWGVVLRTNHGINLRIGKFTGLHQGEHQADKSDTGRIVPEHKVPDHIWAALAKWRLSQ